MADRSDSASADSRPPCRARFGIVGEEEMLGLDYSPVEMLVLHLVHSEVLLRVEASRAQQDGQSGQNTCRFHLFITPVVPAPLFPHRSTVALSGRTTEASDGRCELRNRKNRAAPSGPVPTLQCDAPSVPLSSSPVSYTHLT